MRVSDFILERRSVNVAGRRYMVRALTLGAMLRALDLYAGEIRIAWATAKASPKLWASSWPTVVAEWLLDDERLTDVLALVMDEDAHPGARLVLMRLVLRMTDLPSIAESLNLEDSGPGDPSALCRDIVDMAVHFSCAPHEIMDWPASSFFAAREVLVSSRDSDGSDGINILTNPEALAQAFPQG